jgi:hypothetical protein
MNAAPLAGNQGSGTPTVVTPLAVAALAHAALLVNMKINGAAERKWPNQPPEHAREITIRQSGLVDAAPCDGADGSRRKVALERKPWRVIPTLNVVHAGSTRFRISSNGAK